MMAISLLIFLFYVSTSKCDINKFYSVYNFNIQLLFTLYIFAATINYSLLFLPHQKAFLIKEKFIKNQKNILWSLIIFIAYFISNFFLMMYSSLKDSEKTISTQNIIFNDIIITDFAIINIINTICYIILFWLFINLSLNLLEISKIIFNSYTDDQNTYNG